MNPSRSVPIRQDIRQEWQFAPAMNADSAAIAGAICSSALGGQWLDLGCGPMLSIWPLFSRSPTDVFGLDRNNEVRKYHNRLLQFPSDELPSDISEAYGAGHAFRSHKGLRPIHDPRSLVHEYLKLGGVLISATWTPRPTYAESTVWGGDRLRLLDVDTFVGALQAVGLEVSIVDCSELADPNYKERFVIEARKPLLNEGVSGP